MNIIFTCLCNHKFEWGIYILKWYSKYVDVRENVTRFHKKAETNYLDTSIIEFVHAMPYYTASND